MFSERGFIRPDIEMLGRLIQEKDSKLLLENAANPGLRFSAFPRDLQCTPKDVLRVDETVSTLYVDTRVPESTCYKIIKPLVDAGT